MTSITVEEGWAASKVSKRQTEIRDVAQGAGIAFEDVFQLQFPATQLDQFPKAELVRTLSGVFASFEPSEVLTPHAGDVHSDHQITAEIVDACCKWFRFPSVERVLAYETLSETGFGLSAEKSFKPNLFVDISHWLDRKIELLNLYPSELGDYPFPRSEKAVRALAHLRGSTSGFQAGEAFELLLERNLLPGTKE
jgi:LmbE family N-acetylglucosaminyl deacetylase